VDGFCLGGSGEGKRNSRTRTAEASSQDYASSKQPFLCYILHVERWGRYKMCQTIEKVPPVLDVLDRHVTRVLFKFRQPDHLFNTLKSVKGLLHLVPSRTPRRHVISLMFSLGSSSGSIDSVRIYRSVMRTLYT
jgi:hypothetical protein